MLQVKNKKQRGMQGRETSLSPRLEIRVCVGLIRHGGCTYAPWVC